MTLKDFNPYQTYLNWIEGCGNFECFFKSTPFVCLKNYPNFSIEASDISCNEEYIFNECSLIIGNHNKSKSIFILDLPGEENIKIAYLLQNKLCIKPILTFNAILHPYGLIQGKSFISNLIICGNMLQNNILDGFVFILDKNRYILDSDGKEETSFNNQYETTEEDLPRVEFLKELDYNTVVYIHNEDVKEDINCYLEYLDHFDIKVFNYRIGDSNHG